jgi:uncharacterized protein YnzC (UPF0291/DUF896 family)
MPHAEKKALVITTSGKRPIHDVARDLSAAGFDVEQVLDSINVVTGKGHDASKDKLRSVKGVVDVSDDYPVSIGPPDAEIS